MVTTRKQKAYSMPSTPRGHGLVNRLLKGCNCPLKLGIQPVVFSLAANFEKNMKTKWVNCLRFKPGIHNAFFKLLLTREKYNAIFMISM
jgi:hypothetical protein